MSLLEHLRTQSAPEYIRSLLKTDEKRQFFHMSAVILCLLIIILIYEQRHAWIQPELCPLYRPKNSTKTSPKARTDPPYCTFIISSIPERFNFTFNNLRSRLPGFLDVRKREPVPHSDPRIFRGGSLGVSSLLLTFIDLWVEFGWSSDDDVADDDWMFLIEDDVDIVPPPILSSYHEKKYGLPNSTVLMQIVLGKV